ncbi:acyl-CoA dehydrogenase family protein [Cellulomonas shaoxiangyii]|uniref:acyl-CoA dehydrogenase family protein n=1 Tax=Cellulomonas shaoxiangyii TaxID=2566013 RepID=UPI001AA026E7|nr:acyl-CoA dehydrogenase family protein [Cellulomonas shaoxiangyii]
MSAPVVTVVAGPTRAAAPAPAAPLASLSVLPPGRDAWRTHVRTFARTHVAPRSAAMDAQARIDPDLLPELVRAGLLAVEVPRVYGGHGGDLLDVVVAIEEISRVDPAVGVFVDVQNALVAAALLRHGTGDQRRRYLPRLATGTVGAYALSEPGSGSDAFALTTVAVPDGDGYRLTGRKAWTTSAREAGVLVVFAAVLDGPDAADGGGARRTTAFLVDRDRPGVSVQPPVRTLGIRASSTCDVVLDDVRVGREQVLGGVGDGEHVTVETLNIGKLGIAAQLLGLAEGALAAAVAYAQERRQFGVPVGTFQGVQFPLAQLAAEVRAVRLLVHDGVALMEHPDPAERMAAAATAKLLASQVAERAASQAVETLGGAGFTDAHPVERLYRDAKVGTIYEGTTNMQLRTLASVLLGGAR